MQWGMTHLVHLLKCYGADPEFGIQQGVCTLRTLEGWACFSLFSWSFAFSSLNQASNSAGRWTRAPTKLHVLCAVTRWEAGCKGQHMSLFFTGRRESDIGRNRASCVSHIEQIEICLPPWPLSARKVLPNHKAQYSNVSPCLTTNSP